MKDVLTATNSLCDLLDTYYEQADQQDKFIFLGEQLKVVDKMNYPQLIIKAKAIAALLQDHHVKPGDRVLMIYNPGLEFIYAFFGCLYAGAIAVPCYPPGNKKLVDKLSAIISNCDPKIIISSKDIVNKIKKLKLVKMASSSFLNHLVMGFMKNVDQLTEWDFDKFSWLTTDNINLLLANHYQAVNLKAEDIAFLQYTSGSTSAPKGVMVSHGNIIHNVDTISKKVKVTAQDKIMIWLPPYHDMGLIGGIMVPLYNQAPVWLMSPIDFLRKPSNWLKAISIYQATISAAPNFAYSLCNKKISTVELPHLHLNQWRAALNGAEPINFKTVKQFIDKFSTCGFSEKSFFPCYGLAESTLFVSGKFGITTQAFDKTGLRNNLLMPVKDGQTGKILVSCGEVSGGEVLTIDPETGLPSDVGINEICISGPSVTKGYWRNQTNDENFFTIIMNGKEEKYFKTGDLGFIDHHELFITGRIKELIIIRGTNHYPQDIEETVYHVNEFIRHGCCAAFSKEIQGEEKLIIVAEIKEGLKAEDIAALVTNIKAEIMSHHQLAVHQIAFIPPKSLHKTTSGKIQRYANRAALENNEFTLIANFIVDSQQPTLQFNPKEIAEEKPNKVISPNEVKVMADLRDKIHLELRKLLNVQDSEIKDNQSFSEFGLDSLLVIELENKLQKHLKGIYQLKQNDLFDYPSISLLCNHIQEEIIANRTTDKIE